MEKTSLLELEERRKDIPARLKFELEKEVNSLHKILENCTISENYHLWRIYSQKIESINKAIEILNTQIVLLERGRK